MRLQRWAWASSSAARPTRLPAMAMLPLGLRQNSSSSWRQRLFFTKNSPFVLFTPRSSPAYLAVKGSVLVEPDLLQLAAFLHFLDAHHFDVVQVARQRHHEPRVSVPQAEVDLPLLRKDRFGVQLE